MFESRPRHINVEGRADILRLEFLNDDKFRHPKITTVKSVAVDSPERRATGDIAKLVKASD